MSQIFSEPSNGTVVCKDRSGKLQMFEPADLGKVFLKIEGKA